MAIAFVNKATGTGADNPYNLVVPCGTGSNRVTVVAIVANSVTDRTGVDPTLGGNAMTQIGTRLENATVQIDMWYQVNPGEGNQTFAIGNTNTLTLRVMAATFSGVDTVTPVGDSDSTSSNTLNPASTLTLTVAGSIHVAAVVDDKQSTSGGDGTEIYSTDEGAWVTGMEYTAPGATGNNTITWTIPADNWAMKAVEFLPLITASTWIPKVILIT